MKNFQRILSWRVASIAFAVLATLPLGVAAQQKPLPPEAISDPILRALQAELTRSKSQLKMDNVGSPFYIEYRVFDVEQFDASAAFGALRDQNRTRLRLLRAVVRLGDYKLDSFFNNGQGVSDILPLDNDELAIRHQVWLATDQAYKRAGEAFSNKKAQLKQLNIEQPVDDFAKAEAAVSIGPTAKLDVDPAKWTKMLESATSVYKDDPSIQNLFASLNFTVLTQYFINTEGTVTRHGSTHYQVLLSASEQAPDGMRLDRAPQFTANRIEELPTPEEFQKDAINLLADMKKLREAPIVDEEYRGPVLFSNDAATDMFFELIVPNILGRRPAPGRPARTVGAFASSWHARVLPNFISVVDDPTMETFAGHELGGSYKVDDEGVAAAPVTVVDNGTLSNYLIGRMPIRDFPASNGHGRASGNGNTAPAPGNLFFRPSKTSTREELKKQLIDECRTRGFPYGYYVDTLGPRLSPRMLYRVWVNDGHEELVRGAVFNELDIRALRSDLVAAGDDPLVSNRTGVPFTTIVSPSVLFDELEVKRADNSKEKLPDYPAPSLTAGRN
ncbi:MAG TPA: metallopeptidase TldD-related protein [Candidatus Acidoferrales bacterium]|jgi:predicted Zn-dependent protease|nr:metallopeptidase TldD-related protein [Candidatus Acidoferrales bacterium]